MSGISDGPDGTFKVKSETLNQKNIREFEEQGVRPEYYGGESDPYEPIKVIEAWKLGFHLGNVAKYIARAGKKDPKKEIEDLEKAVTYLQFEIKLKKKNESKSSL